MYALVDANAFYCSAEQVFRPDWRGKPIIVLSNNDGCVVAINRQAKEAGIEKFKPFFAVRKQCESIGAIVCSSNYELYGDISEKMMQIIGRFAPEQHIYSIDESFLSFHRCHDIPDLCAQGQALRKAVWKECRLAVCVGIGPTLTLAKAANNLAKKIQTYNGVCILDTHSERLKLLATMDVNDVWGVGRKIAAKLKFQGIETALQLSQMKTGLARKVFNIELERTVRELNGEKCKKWDAVKADKKQIFSTRSMGKRITNQACLHQALSTHAAIAAAKLRSQGSLCSVMMVFAANSPFDSTPTSRKCLHHFAFPTNDTNVIIQAVSSQLPALFQAGISYYKVGIGLLDLINAQHVHPDLFNNQPNNFALMNIFDNLNQRYGSGTIFMAAQGINVKWEMRREFLSPQYTTSWSDLPSIKC